MPSLTEVVCDELGRFPVARRCCRRAEIATVLRLSAAVGRRDGRLVVVADLDEVGAARRLHILITAAFGYAVRLAARVGGVSRLLVCLAEQGLACRGPGGWIRGDADPDRVGERLEIGEYLGLLRARYRADRAAYHALRRRVADRRQPAETWGPDTVVDVPVGPDPLADAVVDAAVGLVRQALGGVVVADLAA